MQEKLQRKNLKLRNSIQKQQQVFFGHNLWFMGFWQIYNLNLWWIFKIRSRVHQKNQTDDEQSTLSTIRLEEELCEHRRQCVREEYELLKALLQDAQRMQMASLRAKFGLQSKVLKRAQTKKYIKDAQTLNKPRIRTQQEKRRRNIAIKEQNEWNVKIFIAERWQLTKK